MSTTSDRAARATWAAHYATPDGFRYMPAEELVRYCGRRKALGRVLEVGCGSGANLWFLHEHATQTIGIDFCEAAICRAREICRARHPDADPYEEPSLAMASAYQLPFSDWTFDEVVDVMTSQHFPWEDHWAVYREYRRVLKRGGRIFLYHLVNGTSGSAQGRFDYPEGIPLFPDAGRLCLPSGVALRYRLQASGFGQIEERGLDRSYPDGGVTRYAILEGTTTL